MTAAETDRPYTVVVGVSATSGSPAALVWAAAQARSNHGRLIAVRVLKRPPAQEAYASASTDAAQGDASRDHEAALARDVAEALGPDHGAECRVLYGGKRGSVLAVASGADLLVIDAARRPSSSSVLAHRIIASSQCPVVVMPPALVDEPPSGLSRAGRAVGQATLRAVGTSGRAGYRPPELP